MDKAPAILPASFLSPRHSALKWSDFEVKDVRELLRLDAGIKAAKAVIETETSTHKSHTASKRNLQALQDYHPDVSFWVDLPSHASPENRDNDSQLHNEVIDKKEPWNFKQRDIHKPYKNKEEHGIIEGDGKFWEFPELPKHPKFPRMKGEILRRIKESAGEPFADDILYAHHVYDVFQACQKRLPFEEFLQQKAQALQQKSGDIFIHQPQPEAPAPIPDLSGIPRWQGKNTDGAALDFLEAHYGQLLSAFGAEQDVIFQDQIRKHDEKMLQGVIDQLRWEGQARKIKEFVKPRSARTDRELASVPSDSLKHADRLSAAMRMRQARTRTTPKPSSD